MIIDLRSDTVTKPTPGMLHAMATAEVGDDVFEEDPTVFELERKMAKLFGKESGLFFPSGTMANQTAIKILTQPAEEIICDHLSHVYLYEGGGLAFNSGLSIRLVEGNRGRITAGQVLENINGDGVYNTITSIVSIENTCNRGGGSYYKLENIKEISDVCRHKGLKLHLDGARIFNALVESGDSAIETGKLVDTLSICLSKGLGAPVGSVLVSSEEKIRKARRVRKLLGGGMRQVGFLAAAGLYAINHHVERLKEDHKRARILGNTLANFAIVKEILPVETNIVLTKLNSHQYQSTFISKLKDNKILAVPVGQDMVRMVTHLDFNDAMLEKTCAVLKSTFQA